MSEDIKKLEAEAYSIGAHRPSSVADMAAISLAVTFKRLVDMAEPFAKYALAEIEREKSQKKGKG